MTAGDPTIHGGDHEKAFSDNCSARCIGSSQFCERSRLAAGAACLQNCPDRRAAAI
jgi:hypothetical protein